MKLFEPELKALVLNYLRSKGKLSSECTVVNEFAIDGSTRRVDLAIHQDSVFNAFEIKSEADSLARLEGQVSKYLEYFDKVTVVAAPKHIPEIVNIVPANVAVWEATRGGFKIRRRGRIERIQSAHALMDLLTADDLRKLYGLNAGLLRRAELIQYLESIKLTTLRSALINSLENRYRQTNDSFFKAVVQRDIRSNDLDRLSHYKKARQSLKIKELNRNKLEERLAAIGRTGTISNQSEPGSDTLFGAVPEEIKQLVQA